MVKSKILFGLIFIIFIIPSTQILYSQSKCYIDFVKANKFYEKNDYNNAIKFYKKIINSGIINGYIYYNIGTCYLKKDEIGKALFYYKKAKFFIPLNKSLNKNILYVESKVKKALPEKILYKYLEKLIITSKIISIKNSFYLMIFFFYLTILLWILKILKKNKTGIFILSFVFLMIFVITFTFDYYSLKKLKFGYITKNNCYVYSDFTQDAKKLFKVYDGIEIYVLEKQGNFLYVKFVNGVKGWIKKDNAIYNLK